MSSVGRLAAVLCAAVVTAGCSSAKGSVTGSTTTLASDAPSATSTTTAGSAEALEAIGGDGLNGVVLARALVQDSDLVGFEARSVARPYVADERQALTICGVDLRFESELVDGVQSVFVEDSVQVTVTVSAADDAAAAQRFVERFGEVVSDCDQPWTQDAPLIGIGPLEGEVLGPAEVGAPTPQLQAVRIRTRTEAGASDVVAAAFAIGPLVTTVTVAGPVDADLSVSEDAVEAAVRRAMDLLAELG